MFCFGIVVSPCINLYYTNSLQPQWTKAKLIFILLCIYHHSEKTHLKRSWWGLGAVSLQWAYVSPFWIWMGYANWASFPLGWYWGWNWKWTFFGTCYGNRGEGCACTHACSLVWSIRCADVCRLCFAPSSDWSLNFYFLMCWFGFR